MKFLYQVQRRKSAGRWEHFKDTDVAGYAWTCMRDALGTDGTYVAARVRMREGNKYFSLFTLKRG